MNEASGPLYTAARDIAQVAAGLAEGMDGDRRLSADVIKAMTDAGFMRHFVPAEFGGRAGTFRELLGAVAVIGEKCAASAWCASLFASTPRLVSFFPPEGRREVWADGPDAGVVCSVLPFGEAVAEQDGLRVSGRWPYISAIEFADWVIVCPKVLGAGEPELRLVVVPRADCQVEDTWFSVGMRATGSNTVVLDDVFVPAHRVGDRTAVFAGRPADPGAEPPAAPLAPLAAVNGLTFVVPALGAARGALALLSDYLGKKIRDTPALPGVPGVAGNLATYETALARSAAEMDAVQLLLERIADLADRQEEITPVEVARNARDSAFAIEVLVTAVNRIFRTAGTNGQAADGPLQRLWRDVNSMATHQALQFEPTARNYTRSLFATT
ncbi:acyl-CoA dehydrogenase family protein [Streptomyces syringium]|uniref:acyl-CoA dehydrogenase family protein n=1 Tax=Streptomyces syringium TaxID=76729 RepID=UPI00365BD24D